MTDQPTPPSRDEASAAAALRTLTRGRRVTELQAASALSPRHRRTTLPG
jgi:hypothetical protein